AFRTNRPKHEVAVTRDHNERVKLVAQGAGAQKQLIEARRPAVEDAEAILSPLHAKIGLDDTVERILIAQHSVSVQLVEHRLPVMIEKHIMKDERNIVLTARQPKGKWVWIIFISRILFIKQQIKTGKTRVNVGCREIHHVIVIPKSGQL